MRWTKTQQTIIDRLNKDFAFRPCPIGVDPGQHGDREHVRSILGSAAIDLARIAPQSRELNHALNHLEEAVGSAHAAIDRHSPSRHEEEA